MLDLIPWRYLESLYNDLQGWATPAYMILETGYNNTHCPRHGCEHEREARETGRYVTCDRYDNGAWIQVAYNAGDYTGRLLLADYGTTDDGRASLWAN